MKALLIFLFTGSIALADAPAPTLPAVTYDCLIMNVTPDGAKVKFYAHKRVTLSGTDKVTLYHSHGLIYQIGVFALQGVTPIEGNVELSILKDNVPLPKGVVATASSGFSTGGAPDSIDTYGWHTRAISCVRVH